ncbi:hypothetical protein V5O48_013093, partial [Marasmius crinis-equi]
MQHILPRPRLSGHLSNSGVTRQRRRKKPIYLFVPPLSTSTPSEDCTTSSLHYWSLDPTGDHPLPTEIRQNLGLPVELFLEIRPTCQYRWDNERYKWMHEYQLARGFDPKTPDYARHLGYPIFQVQSDSDHFEEVDVTTTSSTQSPPAVSTSSVVTKTSLKMNGALHTEAELEERIDLTSEFIARSASTFTHPSPMRPPTTLTEAHKTSSRESIVGNRRSINGKTEKTVKREGGFS